MKRIELHRRHGALLAALVLASCSQGPTAPTANPAAATKASGIEGAVRGSAAGDMKNGPIEINLVRVAQTDGVPAFYASAGGEYVVRPTLAVEIYVQIWTSDPAVANPRLIIDWGGGDKDNTGCGSCRLSKTYNTEGKRVVTVTMDDRISGITTRTFTLNVQNGLVDPVKSGFGTFSGSLAVTDPQYNRRNGIFAPPATGLPCSISLDIPNYYRTYSITHLGGPLRVETTAASLAPFAPDDTYLFVYAGSFNPGNACQNSVAANDDDGVGFLALIQGDFPAGDYVVVVTSYLRNVTGTYTLVIQ